MSGLLSIRARCLTIVREVERCREVERRTVRGKMCSSGFDIVVDVVSRRVQRRVVIKSLLWVCNINRMNYYRSIVSVVTIKVGRQRLDCSLTT